MSRTIRRKTGYRWFATKQANWEFTGKYTAYVVVYYVVKNLKCEPVVDPSYYRIVWEDIETRPEYDKKLIAKWTRDKYLSNQYTQSLKQESSSVSRAAKRQQLHLIMRGQEHYDDGYELSVIRGLERMYD